MIIPIEAATIFILLAYLFGVATGFYQSYVRETKILDSANSTDRRINELEDKLEQIMPTIR